jgi:hypothetical protein
MSSSKPPKKKLQLRPGESPWDAAARELAKNPDSPASLHIMSAMSKAMAPRQRAIDQVVDALEAQIQNAGEQQAASVSAAIQNWEREFVEPMTADRRADLEKEARSRIANRRRRPPSMETVLASPPPTTDTGYHLGVHLEGIQGTWHRLWAMIAMVHSFGNDIHIDESVKLVRKQFEDLLGRPMSEQEWQGLVAHAVHHAETQMSHLPRP